MCSAIWKKKHATRYFSQLWYMQYICAVKYSIYVLHNFLISLPHLLHIWTCFTSQHANTLGVNGCSISRGPAPMTYPDVALCAHNNGVIGQLQTWRASEHSHPVLGELQGDNHSFIDPCNITRTQDLCLMRRQWNTTHTFSDMVLSANPGSSPHMEKRCSCSLVASMTTFISKRWWFTYLLK